MGKIVPRTLSVPTFCKLNGRTVPALACLTAAWYGLSFVPASQAAEPDVLLELHPAEQTAHSTQDYEQKVAPKASRVFDIEVGAWGNVDTIDSIIQKIVDVNVAHCASMSKLDQEIVRLRKPSSKALASAQDSLNHALEYRGTDPSSRAGRILLDEPIKRHNLAIAEFARQKYVDKIHSDVVASLLQISLGAGLSEKRARVAAVDCGVEALTRLIGKPDAYAATRALQLWLTKANQNQAEVVSLNSVSVMEQEVLLQSIVQQSVEKDDVVKELKKRLDRYAHPGMIKAGISKLIESTLSGISLLGPGFAVPLTAEGLLNGYEQATGGSEEGKLEKELVFGQRVENRVKVLSREAALGLENYRLAMLTNNVPLRNFSLELLKSMTSSEFIVGKMNAGKGLPDSKIIPSIVETVDEDD